MSSRSFNVLFLCTGNSARSIMAEALLNAVGRDRHKAYSAGSRPAGTVHPLALEMLASRGLPIEGLRSKSWEEFARPGAPRIDLVVTVCGGPAGDACPVWPGSPLRTHWAIGDPGAVSGSDEDRRRAFREAFDALQNRMLVFTSLPVRKLGREVLQKRLDEIGQMGNAGEEDPTSLADRIQAASRPVPNAWRTHDFMKDLLRPQS